MDGPRAIDAPPDSPFLSTPRISFPAQARHSLEFRETGRRDIGRALAGSFSGRRVPRAGDAGPFGVAAVAAVRIPRLVT